MSTVSPTISVAIPTLGRFEEVRDTILGILRGTVLPLEIVVSDQNSVPIAELDRFLATTSPLIRHIRTAPKGVVFNMNTLLRECRAEIILFVDDDIVAPPTLVESHLANYCDESVSGVAGRVEQPSGDLPPEKVRLVGHFNRWTGKMIFRFNGLTRQPCVFAQGANMSFRRTRLIETGGFDEGFAGNGYFFESDATLRLVRATGKKMIFDPISSVIHLAAPRGGARVTDRAIHHSFFVFNALRLYRRHSPQSIFAYHFLRLVLLTIAKSVYRRSFRITRLGISAAMRGIRQPMGIQKSAN